VIVAEISDGRELCSNLYGAVTASLPEYAEKRTYHPHATLGRVRRNSRVAPIGNRAVEPPVRFEIERLVLFESLLRPEGAVYRELFIAELS
jgi:2'-5' RNA ligase